MTFDLTTGIAQSSAPDLSAFGEHPWEAEARLAEESRQREFAENQKAMDRVLLDPDSFFADKDLGTSPDPERVKRLAVNTAFLQLHAGTDEIPAMESDPARGMWRARVARELFDGRGAESEEAFQTEILKDATGRKDQRELDKRLVGAAIDDAMLPSYGRKGAGEWLKAAEGQPGFSNRADHLERWGQVSMEMAEKIAPFKDPLEKTWVAMRNKIDIPREELAKVSDADWPMFLTALRLRAETLPDDEKESFLDGMIKDAARTGENFARQTGEGAAQIGLDAPGMGPISGAAVPLNPATTELLETRKAEFNWERNRAHEVRRIFDSKFDVIDYAEGLGWLQKAPGVAATSMAMVMPGAGQPIMFAQMTGSAQESLYLNMHNQGLSEAQAGQYADTLAPLVAIPQFAMEKVGFGLWANKLPLVSQVLTNISNKVSNRALRFAVRTGAITAGETLVEVNQDFTESVVQDIASAIDEEIPGRDLGAEFISSWKQAPEIAGSMLFLSVLGAAGGLNAEARNAAFAATDRIDREAWGISPEANDRIDAAAKQGPASLAKVIEEELPGRNPESDSAKAAKEKLAMIERAKRVAQQRLENLGYTPTKIMALPDGTFEVRDSVSGELVGTGANFDETMRVVAAHSTWVETLRADEVMELATLVASGNILAKETGVAQEVDTGRRVTVEEKAGESARNAERIREEMGLLEEAGSGDASMTYLILGETTTELRNEIRQDVSRLFEQGHLGTMLEETIHAKHRQARAQGLTTRERDIAILRAFDTVLAKYGAKPFIPAGMADHEISETRIEEAIGHIAQMEIFRTPKGGKNTFNLPRALVSKHIGAVAGITGQGTAFKFKAMIEALRARMGAVLKTYRAVKKAEAAGEFDRATVDSYLADLLGAKEQDDHEAGVREELGKILGEPIDPATVEADDIPFSIGRATVTPGAETRVFNGTNGETVIGPAAFSIQAFHGTPHKVDRFSLDKIGTGEGNQAYGWGLYFAQDERVAEQYRDKLTAHARDYTAVLDGKRLEYTEDIAEAVGGDVVAIDAILDAKWRASLEEAIAAYDPADSFSQPRIAWLKENGHRLTFPKSNLYTVNLKVDEEDLLDWDKPLSEQGEKVKANLKSIQWIPANLFSPPVLDESGEFWIYQGNTYESRREALEDATGFELVMGRLGGKSPKQISLDMLAAGIRGIRFLDGNSRGKGEGSYNYVIFDDADIEILEENGQPVDKQAAAFSIAPAVVAERMRDSALARINDPRRRVQVMKRIARDFDNLRLTIDRLTHLSGRKRSKYELRMEANAREDLAAEEKIAEIHARYGSLLADEDLVKIKAQPIHAYLADPDTPLRGRLMSKAAAIKAHPDRYALHRAGEYDGAEGVSRSLFGGQLMPDQAAQELFEAGLISEPLPDLMWQALLAEQRTVAGMKEMMAKAQEEIRQVKRDAKQEANEWLATQSKDQDVNFSPKAEILRSLRLLDAILLAMPAEVRGKIGGYTQIAQINSDEARLAFLKDKLEKADVELEKFLRVEFDREFWDIMRKARPEKDEAGQRPIGKIAADALDILRVAEMAVSMGFVEGEAEADKWDAIADNPDTPLAEADKARATAQLVRLTMNWHHADAARREQAVVEADRIYFGGLAALAKEKSRRYENMGKIRDSAQAGTGKTGHRMEREAAKFDSAKQSKTIKELAWEFLSFGQLVNVLFGEKSAAARWFNGRELAASNAYEDGFQAKANALEALMDSLAGSRFGGEKLRHKLATDRSVKVVDLLGVEHLFTESQGITFLLTWRQEDGKRHMRGKTDEAGNIVGGWGWGEEQAAEVERQLSPQAKAVMAFLSGEYGSEYERINAVFRRIWNVSMPRHKMYAPISVAPAVGKSENSITDPVSGDTMGASMTPGSLKNRSNTAVAEPNFNDAFQTYLSHARQMEHFIAYGEFSRDALAILNRRETRNAIEAAGGPNAANTLSKWIDYFSLGGIRDASSGSKWVHTLGGMIGRLSQAALVGRVSVLAMQSLQLGAAAYHMPVGAYLTRLARLHLGLLDWKGAFQSEYIQRRIEQMPPVVRDAVQGLAAGNPNRAKYAAAQLGKTIAGADGLFTSGTYAIIYDYHLTQARKAGLDNPEAYAHAEAERLTDQVAQPTRTGARSWMEVANSGNPAFRAMWNFASDPRQKISLAVYEAMRRDKSGKAKAAALGKSVAVTWLVSGVLQTLLRAVIRDLRSPEDDEVFDERHWNPVRLALMAAAGPFGAIPYFGGMIEDSTYAATGQYMPKGGLLDTVTAPAKLVPKWIDGDLEPLKDAETVLSGGAGFSGTSAALSSFMHLIRDAVGIVENATGTGD